MRPAKAAVSPRSKRSLQQSALVELGSFALEESDLATLFDKASSLLCGTLQMEFCEVLQLVSGGKSLLLINGCGWKRALFGKATVSATLNSPAGYALRTNKLLVMEDLHKEERFEASPLLEDHGVVSGLTIPLHGQLGAWGVLGVQSRRRRRFAQSERDFFQSAANIVSSAIRKTEQERALAEADDNLRLALQITHIGTWYLDPQTKTTTRDANLNRIFGLQAVDSTEQLDDFLAIVHPEDRQKILDRLQQALQSRQLIEAEIRIIRPDGSVRWVQGRGKVLPDGRLTGAAIDITERKRGEESLAWFAAVVESSQDAIIGKSLDGTIMSWNTGAEKIFGYRSEEVIGKNIREILPKDRKEELVPIYDKLRNRERVEPFETIRIRKDGTPVHVSVAISAVRDCEQNIMGASAIIRDISRRKLAEAISQQNQERLQIALEAGRMGVWEWCIRSGRITWSPNLEALHGIPEKSFPGTFEAFQQGIHPEEREMVLERIRRAVEDRHPFTVEYRLSNGRWVEGRGKLLLDVDGNPERMVGICTDINDRKKSENALRESEERFRQLADAAPVLIWLSDKERCCSYFNKGWLTFRGRSAEQELGHGWLEGVHPEDREYCLETHQNAAKGHNPFQITYRIRRHDGEYRCLLCSAAPRHTSDGSFVGFVGSAIDITDVTRAEEALRQEAALRESEKRFREMADAMPQIVWEAKPDGYFDYFNKRWHDFTGVNASEGSVEMWKPIVHAEDWEHCMKSWEKSLQTGAPIVTECRFKNAATQEYRWHLTRMVAIRSNGTGIKRWIGTATDIQHQKDNEQALAEAKEELRKRAESLESAVHERTAELEDSLKTTETLLYTIAHDLRAPLRAMQGMTIAVLEDYGDHFDHDGREYLDRIAAAAQRMDRLIADLLAYGRLGHVDLPTQRLDLSSVVYEVVQEWDLDIKKAKAQIIVRTPMPTVTANGVALKQVISNLLSNAMKFIPPGVEPRVELRAETQGDFVRVYISDNGIGIDPSHRGRIFDVFQRLHTQEAYSGTGIGLAIVAKAVQRMGGTVGVESQVGQGSCFWFDLPK